MKVKMYPSTKPRTNENLLAKKKVLLIEDKDTKIKEVEGMKNKSFDCQKF